jgi:heterodisulfide reductase subunit A-like polyferredoxin
MNNPKENPWQAVTSIAEDPPVGAVLVAGGGIAGMQSALDLADQGFKVYLVESAPAIGGKMAQLDKTFPTNDCAMCTISPRLVEVGRHPNIQIMTNTELMGVSGQAGHFTATLQHQPRYIDPLKCIACGDCVKVCPVEVPDPFNEGLVQRRAAFKLYPQAVPNAFAIEKRGISPCRDACPSGQRVQGYIALIREGRWQDAIRVIKMDNPFPGICGRICNHRCEDACNRGGVDEPINIRALKRFVTDKVYEDPPEPVQPAPLLHSARVAVIGSGPCGLTAAQDLLLAGYPVTVFEAMPVAGGMLRLGVPEYRLPVEIIEREVQAIVDLGVDLRLNHRVDDLDDLFDAGYEAVLIAVGAHEGVRLPIPGADLEGVLVNTHFLRDVRLGGYQAGLEGKGLGDHVLVLGGGNVAIDCARTAVRLGCKVSLACLESREQMPAHDWEIQAAEEEGVALYPGRSFEEILGDVQGRVTGVVSKTVSSFRFDENGRLTVEKVPDSSHTLFCDTVIFSVGQRAGLAFIPPDAGVGITSRQTIAVNPNTLAATRPGVFAAGDSVSGTAFVIEAVDSGHKAAQSIRRYLEGEALEPAAHPDLPVVHLSQQELQHRLNTGEIHIQKRIGMPQLSAKDRRDSFAEVEGGYDDASAQAEAARCLACGICSECMSCTFACGVKAINHDEAAWIEKVEIGSVILTPGYQVYQAELSQEYGFGRFPNVVTSLQFERLLSASGPTSGHIRRPSDNQKPQRIAFLQCVGSRDQTHDYCSAVCCMYATKEAVIAKEHERDLHIQIFMMDMRAFSKGYWSYYERARERYGIEYTRCRISGLHQNSDTNDLIVEYADETGEIQAAVFDLVVLSVGMEIPASVRDLTRRLDIRVNHNGFCMTGAQNGNSLNPLETSRPGIFAAGAFRGPKDIPEALLEASGAAAAAASGLYTSRSSLTRKVEYPSERDVRHEAPRTGIFVCHCGSNIGGYLDVPVVADYAKTLPDVVHSEANLYTCSQDSIRHITEVIEEQNLNRVVVASCTPLTHAPLFQDSLRAAGLNPFLFEMANIRNHCSWVHSNDHDTATEKAKDLVRMAAARAALLEPQTTVQVPVNESALVVGGGPAGMMAALCLAGQGFPVHLVEREDRLGGNLRNLQFLTPQFEPGQDLTAIRNAPGLLEEMVDQVVNHPLISLHLNSRIRSTKGFLGNFTSMIDDRSGGRSQVQYGAAVLATGGREYRGADYGLGSHPRILTQLELEALLAHADPDEGAPENVVMILCVGPAEAYCSRICCTTALKNALALKAANPAARITILYQDIRTYGQNEKLYTEARRQGVIFMRYERSHPPAVDVRGAEDPLQVQVWDQALKRSFLLQPDCLVLAMPVIPDEDTSAVAATFKVSKDKDGFLQEAHVKMRPVDFATDGIYMAGMAHYPKLLDEALIQAQAAAARAARMLSQASLTAGGRVAVVDAERCTGCLTCIRICPYQVPMIKADRAAAGGILGAAYIEPAVCQGCGTCAGECPAQAIQLMHYTDAQMAAKIRALALPDNLFHPEDLLVIEH